MRIYQSIQVNHHEMNSVRIHEKADGKAKYLRESCPRLGFHSAQIEKRSAITINNTDNQHVITPPLTHQHKQPIIVRLTVTTVGSINTEVFTEDISGKRSIRIPPSDRRVWPFEKKPSSYRYVRTHRETSMDTLSDWIDYASEATT